MAKKDKLKNSTSNSSKNSSKSSNRSQAGSLKDTHAQVPDDTKGRSGPGGE